MATDYVELHCHSAYSFLDGVAHPEELVDRACALGYTALALTDHDNLCAALPFAHAAQGAGLQAITGCELTVDVGQEQRHLVLLVESRVGYTNLCRLITAAHAGTRAGGGAVARPPSVALERVLMHAEGLSCLTGCPERGVLHSCSRPLASVWRSSSSARSARVPSGACAPSSGWHGSAAFRWSRRTTFTCLCGGAARCRTCSSRFASMPRWMRARHCCAAIANTC
jgi:hypothetical protein